MSTRSPGILVAGMHRSGTSAVAGALQALGVNLGPRLVAAAGDNPKGYFEHERVVIIHETLFRALGSWWYDPRPLPEGWMATPAAREAEEALVQALREDFAGAAAWAVKDPRVCRFLPLWRKVLDRLAMPAGALLVLRSPAEVAASLTARNGFGPELGELLWLRHVLDSVRDTAGLERTVVLYEDLVANPAQTMGAALARIGVQGTAPTAAQATALSAFVETGFRHHDGSGDKATTPLALLARQVFTTGRALAHGGTEWRAFEVHRGEFDRLWAQLGPGMQAMADAVFPELQAKARLSEEFYAVKAELNAQLRWSDQVLEQHRQLSEQRDALQLALTTQRDALQVELAHARSDLTAQVRWAEQTVAQHGSVIAEAQAQAARDREQLAHLQALAVLRDKDLQAGIERAEALERELAAVVTQSARDREERERLHEDQRRSLEALRASLKAQLAQLQSTLSWRITAPFRALLRLLPGAAPVPPAGAGSKESEGNES